MTNDSNKLPLNLDEVKKILELHAKPIDLEDLISKGILEKKGAWYKVHNFDELPEYASVQVSSIKSENSNTYIKFSKANQNAKNLLDKLSK